MNAMNQVSVPTSAPIVFRAKTGKWAVGRDTRAAVKDHVRFVNAKPVNRRRPNAITKSRETAALVTVVAATWLATLATISQQF